MKKLFFACLSLCLLYSCSEADLTETQDQTLNVKSTPRNDNYLLKKKFAIALHKAMKEHQDVRDFLKTEALKKFDGDYDILYGYISDELINGTSFRDILSSYFDSLAELEEIENTIPALTIFIPELPENSFSATNWNTSNDVPMVAIRLLDNDKTPVITSDAGNYLLDGNAIPAFPVVVIKECERVIVSSFPFYGEKTSKEYIGPRNFRFRFSDPIFDFIGPRGPVPPEADPDPLVAAWELNGKGENLGWHRDYIYYTINPGTPNGYFINNFEEHLRSFRLEGDAQQALELISSPSTVNSNLSDPSLTPITVSGNVNYNSFWTDGSFEFNVFTDYNVNTSVLEKGFHASPYDLFDIVFQQSIPILPVYHVVSLTKKTYHINLPIINWKLHEYSNTFKFKFEEQDLDVEVTTQESRQSKYNTNFSYEGEILKIGYKLGNSAETTLTTTTSAKWHEQSNDLREVLVDFGDNVIIGEEVIQHPFVINHSITNYAIRQYTTGKCSFSLVPVKVQ
ncbi:hypothetical protein [Flavobacterium beibuense]|nr:hypothetical protein [Flavobacterium beibuense]